MGSVELPLRERTLSRFLREKARANGGHAFLRFEGMDYSYAQAWEISSRLADGLYAAGIRHGQHVAIMLENRPEVLWLHFALAQIGAVAVPINNASRGDLLAYYVTQSDSVALVVETSLVERYALVHDRCPKVGLIVAVDSAPGDAATVPALPGTLLVQWSEAAAGGAQRVPDEVRFDDMLHILYSSGTTGPSKGSMICNATAITVAARYVEGFGYRRDDVLFTCLPLFHGNSWNCTILPAMVADATVALSRRFSARSFWREIQASGATASSLLSAMINILWMQSPSPQEREHRLRMCQVVPVPAFASEFERRYNLRITSLYSLSDFGLAAMFGPDAPREKLGSAGRPVAQMAVAVVDDDDLPLAAGQVGEICLRNNEAWFGRQGYYRMGDAWAAACRNLWFHTGDLGRFDGDGYLYFTGRKKDVIRRRGENISAVEVEQIIMQHPAVADVAVFPVQAEFAEDEVMASIVCRPGESLQQGELVEFCATRMAYFMVPRFVEFAGDLPLTPTGKVEKYKLRAAAQAHLAAVWDREKNGIVLAK